MIPVTSRRYAFGFAVAGALLTILFLALVNVLTSRDYLWFVYPSFAVLWWPAAVICAHRHPKVFSVVGAFMTLLFLAGINLMFSPSVLWVLYAAFPVACWPVLLFLGKRAGRPAAAFAVSLLAAAYYVLLNVFYSPGFPWAVCPIYAVMWWPIAVLFAKNKKPMALSAAGSVWSILFFIILNAVTTPWTIWAVYPVFGILWWPLSVFCFVTFEKQAAAAQSSRPMSARWRALIRRKAPPSPAGKVRCLDCKARHS